jgi:hypothetical protein
MRVHRFKKLRLYLIPVAMLMGTFVFGTGKSKNRPGKKETISSAAPIKLLDKNAFLYDSLQLSDLGLSKAA